jgi:hypothetical protein
MTIRNFSRKGRGLRSGSLRHCLDLFLTKLTATNLIFRREAENVCAKRLQILNGDEGLFCKRSSE